MYLLIPLVGLYLYKLQLLLHNFIMRLSSYNIWGSYSASNLWWYARCLIHGINVVGPPLNPFNFILIQRIKRLPLPYSIWVWTRVLYKHVNVFFEILLNDFFISTICFASTNCGNFTRSSITTPRSFSLLHSCTMLCLLVWYTCLGFTLPRCKDLHLA